MDGESICHSGVVVGERSSRGGHKRVLVHGVVVADGDCGAVVNIPRTFYNAGPTVALLFPWCYLVQRI